MKNQNYIIEKGFRPQKIPIQKKKLVDEQPSPTPTKVYSLKYIHLPKALWVWLRYRFARIVIDIRNRPIKILKYPNKKLKRIAVDVDFEKTTLEERTKIVRKMGNSLASQTYGGKLGLAAPQIGINLRVIIVRGNVMFNPIWEPMETPPNQVTEGCYSVPNRVFKVPRKPYCRVKWTNIEGGAMEDKLTKIAAIVFQHEFDHLNGKCCIDVGEEVPEPSRTPKPIKNN